MKRPTLEVADIVRSAGNSFIERNQAHLSWPQLKVLRAIQHCRTAALGGHLDQCSRCGYRAISFFSCRNRHCPKCQTNARNKWLAARSQELLGVSYCHVVFTLPHELSALALQNKKAIYDLLFQTSAATLLEVAADPKHLGAEIGFLSVLHTWGQNLQAHPHLHCVIPAGGLSPDHARWIHPKYPFFLPVKVLSRVFRGKFGAGLKRLLRQNKLRFHGRFEHLNEPKPFHAFLRQLFRQDWVVYAKPPFGGPEYVLQYLARYTHRVAISNHRLVSMTDGNVTFRWKDYPRQQKAQDDPHGRRIPASVPAACVAARLCAHPSFRVSVRRATARASGRQPSDAGRNSSVTIPNAQDNPGTRRHLALPLLWRHHGHDREAHRSADPPPIHGMEELG